MPLVGLLVCAASFEPARSSSLLVWNLTNDVPAESRCPGAVRDSKYNGSKPIIASTGSRRVTRLVEVQEVATELTLDGNVNDFHLPELELILAELYQLPPSTLEVEVVGGSAILRLRIADVSTARSIDIAAAISAVGDATLSAAVGTHVTRSSSVQITSRNVSREEESPCPRGHWCTAALTIEW